jgi:BirA family biotin operon repressor/biotin-[acetyl-CoA-carboxylase] ligase
MQFSFDLSVVNRLEHMDQTGSTNSDLVAAAVVDAASWPDLSVLCASSQTAGRGRAGREWESKAGSSLAVSILVRPNEVSLEHFGWLPILAGLAMTQTVAALLPQARVELKWPNDVLVNDKKISGVLSELLPDGRGVVIGAGLNLSQIQAELPIAAATSLALEGILVSFEAALESYLGSFVKLYREFVEHRGNSDACGLRRSAQAKCGSIGRRVRAVMPGDQEIEGTAVSIDESGRLLISVDGQDQLFVVAAGDIVHLRHN